MSGRLHSSAARAGALPELIRLDDKFVGVRFEVMKLLPALAVITAAEEKGTLRPGQPVLASSSGTFAVALSRVCATHDHPLTIISDPSVRPLCRQLDLFGARVQIVESPAEEGGFQQARLDRAAALREQEPGYHWIDQYDNPQVLESYAPVAERIARLTDVDVLVGVVGSGSSLCGTARALRRCSSGVQVVAVDAFNSGLFGLPDGPRLIPGMGNSIRPANLRYEHIDQVHWLGAAEIAAAARSLCRRHGLFMGPTSGAAYRVGMWCAQQQPDADVAVLLPDEGHRYTDTIYDDAWLHARVERAGQPQHEPQQVSHPAQACPGWAYFDWGRRAYAEATAAETC